MATPFFADDYSFLDRARQHSLLSTLLLPDPLGNYWRPVSRQAWFALIAAVGNQSPIAFHLANLFLFAAILVMLFVILRPRLGSRIALTATALLSVHHSADVPVLWASGCQDLLSVLGALVAIWCLGNSRPLYASAAFALALLSKEVVLATPIIAALILYGGGERFRASISRIWPLGVVILVWLAAIPLLSSVPPGLKIEPGAALEALPAVLVHFAQTVVSLEATAPGFPGVLGVAPPLAVLITLGALWIGWGTPIAPDSRRVARMSRDRWVLVGAAWATLGALPIAPVVAIWSAYYFLFAMIGAVLVIALIAGARHIWCPLSLVLLSCWSAQVARSTPPEEGGPSPWTMTSHVNARYIEIGVRESSRYLSQLMRAHPRFAPSSTLFFSGIPARTAFQTGDGPMLRWAYRDTSLRSYFLSAFRMSLASRGPVWFFQASGDTLLPINGPDALTEVGFGLVLDGAFDGARDAYQLAYREMPDHVDIAYRLAWIEAGSGHLEACRVWLERAGLSDDHKTAGETDVVLALARGGRRGEAIDLARQAIREHAMDPRIHALLADILLSDPVTFDSGVAEALAVRSLNPNEALAWRRWARIEAATERLDEASVALERYFALAPMTARADSEALRMREVIRLKVR